MGSILEGTCHKCGYHAELYVGGGLQDCSPEAALRAAHNNPALAAALKENAWFQIDRNAAVCNKCRQLVTATDVTYQLKGKQKRLVTGTCPSCHGPLLTWPSKDTAGIPCPVCGQPVSLVPVGRWD